MSFLHTNDLSEVKNGEFGLDFKVGVKTVVYGGLQDENKMNKNVK